MTPATVSHHQSDSVRMLNYGPVLHAPSPMQTLQEAIDNYNTPWFWQSCSGLSDTTWLAEAIDHSTLLGITDGSYMWQLDKTATSMAYILICTTSGKCITGLFAESSPNANAYRGELLGLLAKHLLLEQVQALYGQSPTPIAVYSDCKSAIHKIQLPRTDLYKAPPIWCP